jgi:hypothetical protein
MKIHSAVLLLLLVNRNIQAKLRGTFLLLSVMIIPENELTEHGMME